jgi:hypothetical protein
MVEIMPELGRHRLDRQLEIHQPGLDRAAQHAVVRRGLCALYEHEAAMLLDRAQALCPVVAAAGEDDAGGVVALVLGERYEKAIDGGAVPGRLRQLGEAQSSTRDRQAGVLRNDVDLVWLDRDVAFDLMHRHGRHALQELGQDAAVVGGKMLNQNEGQAAVDRRG